VERADQLEAVLMADNSDFWDTPVKVSEGLPLPCQSCGAILNPAKTVYRYFFPFCSKECADSIPPLPKELANG
jgi:hypothetical protein